MVAGTIAGDRLFGLAQVTVAGADTNAAIELAYGGTISGSVRFAGGNVATSNWNELQLRLLPLDAPAVLSIPPALVETSGKFAFLGVPPGRYRLVVPVANGKWFPEAATRQSLDLLESELVVRPGENIDGVIVSFTDRPSELRGTLTDNQGRPVSDYLVFVFPTDRKYWSLDSRRTAQALVDGSGHYSFRGMPSGTYHLAVVTDFDPFKRVDTQFFEQLASGSATVDLAAGEVTTQNVMMASDQALP
jgi:hypothetical protein